MNQLLPPYSGDNTTCVKCGFDQAHTEYQPTAPAVLLIDRYGNHQRGPLPERLQRRCNRCDYTWDEALNPPAHDGPSIAEAKADDRRWWGGEKTGE